MKTCSSFIFHAKIHLTAFLTKYIFFKTYLKKTTTKSVFYKPDFFYIATTIVKATTIPNTH